MPTAIPFPMNKGFTLIEALVALIVIALVATVPIVTLGQALHDLRLPDKLCHLLLFTYRYLYVFEQEFRRLVLAMKIRGFQPSQGQLKSDSTRSSKHFPKGAGNTKL